MKPRVFIFPEAQRDLDEQFVYIGERNFDAAERFEAAVRDDLGRLAGMPGMGALREFASPHLLEMRSWPVHGFENHLIFYRPVPDGIEVIRIIHGARDLDRIFRE